ncbi:hypothetical protein [Methylomonas sp. AM2-LC]|uniref:hypothetical protein n=1 Tax=Methylomonas sp. AM2-LC TaxID=3153301 RepID=UPI0032658DC4
MTTTAYDTHFIASDIAFTDGEDNVHLDVPFRKVKRIKGAVIGMAGCLECMVDFSNMILNFILQKSDDFIIPATIVDRKDRDFIVMVYINGSCIKIQKLRNSEVKAENITQIPTVIGSGSKYVQNVINDCPNAVVAVLEAIKHDKYTDGEVKYCSIRRDDVHNLEAYPMSTELEIQVFGFQKEVEAANDFLNTQDNQGKVFQASTEVYHVGTPSPIPLEIGMNFIKQGFFDIKKSLSQECKS